MASLPVYTISNPDIQSARNGGENRIGVQTDMTGPFASDQRERNKAAERHRRKSMSQLFDALHSLLPHPIPKQTDKVSVLDEAIDHITVLRAQLEHLKNAKAALVRSKSDDMDHQLNDLKVKVEGDSVDITMWHMNQWAPLAEILNELEMQGLELINCSSFIDDARCFRHFNTKSVWFCSAWMRQCYRLNLFRIHCKISAPHSCQTYNVTQICTSMRSGAVCEIMVFDTYTRCVCRKWHAIHLVM